MKVIQARNGMAASSVEELAAREGELRQTCLLFCPLRNYPDQGKPNF